MRYLLILLLTGCASASDVPLWRKTTDEERARAEAQNQPAGVSAQQQKDAAECRYEAIKHSPPAVSNLAGLGAAIGAAAANEARLYAMCMRMRGW